VPGQNVQFVNDFRDVRRNGANLLMRLGKEHGDSGWSVQGYYDRTERVTNVTFEVDRDTFDLDWRHHFKLGDQHDIMWGLSARHTRDHTENGSNLLVDPSDGALGIYGGFVQDTITLVPERLFAMIGSKFSHNDYTGFEVQPSARIWWTPNEHNTLWASVSRAVRIPSRTEEQGTLVFGYIDSGVLAGGPPSGQIIGLGIQPNDNLQSERLIAYEAGYRVRPCERLSIDASLFYNTYDRLIYVPSIIDAWNNNGFGETYGGEIALNWRVADNWRLKASYSHVDVQIHGPIAPYDENNTPQNQAQLQSYLDITKDLELNAGLYFVDKVSQVRAEAHVRFDIGVTWRATQNFELAVWGQNLLDSQHAEFSDRKIEVERGVFVKGTVRF
jgi:iron complex outermembrane receptor protein